MMNRMEKSPLSKAKKITRTKAQPQKIVLSRNSQKSIVSPIHRKHPPLSPKHNIKVVTNGIPKTQKISIDSMGTQQKIYLENNDWYSGQLEGNTFSGSGVYYMSQEKLEYQGSFKNGLFDGQGVIIDSLRPYRQVYRGQWKEGKKDGRGTYQYSQTEKYEGQWRQNEKNGYGEYESSEGSYKGHWINDKKHGQGTLKMKKGISLIGQWYNNEFKAGKIIYSDGSVYNGSVSNFNRQGKGEYEYPDNSKYRGDWKNSQKDGRGMFEFNNGDVFDGGFKNNQKDGRNCIYRWREGSEIRNVKYERNLPVSGTFYDVSTPNIDPREFNFD